MEKNASEEEERKNVSKEEERNEEGKEEDFGMALRMNKRRVKVYQLDDQGQWEDKGTGYIDCTFLKKFEGMGLLVKSEKEPRYTILETKIYNEDIYQLQAETLIVWNEPTTDVDLALSFQESMGCREIWDSICSVQKVDSETGHRRIRESYAELPVPSVANLEKIERIVSTSTASLKREQLVNSLLRDNGAYLKQLFELFKMVEDLEDKDCLHLFFNIFKGLILLNETHLMETLFTDEYVYGTLGPLEYDPEVAKPAKHREYIKNQVVFKEIIPIQNPAIIAKIHISFRLQYLKDVILPRTLDDPTFGTINSLIFLSNVDIVNAIQSDQYFMSQIFEKISQTVPSSTERRNCVAFVQELCNLAKHLQTQQRLAFYQNLHRHGICDVLQETLRDGELSIRLISIHILDSILGHEPSLIRSFILSQKPQNGEDEGYTFFSVIFRGLLEDPELGVRVQLTEIVRAVLDITNTNEEQPKQNQNSEKEEFLNIFYDSGKFINKLVEPLQQTDVQPSVAESICEILSFCVQNHGYRIRYYLLNCNLVGKVLKLMKSPHRHVVLATIRFFRAFVGMKDDFFNRHIAKHALFDPIIEAFTKNGNRYNLLNSAIIELFEFIRRENIKNLIAHLHEKYKEILEKVDYVDTCKLIILKYEQNQQETTESQNSVSTQPSSGLSNSRELVTQDDEEYFKEDSIDTENNSKPKEKVEDIPFQPRKHSENDIDDDIPVKSPPKANSPGKERKGKISFNIKSNSTSPQPNNTANPIVVEPCTTEPASAEAVNPNADITASNIHDGLKTIDHEETSESSAKRQRTE